MFDVPVNYLAILVAAIASMVIGALWYSPVLFAKAWTKAMGKSDDEIKAMSKDAGKSYIFAFIGALVLAYVLAHFVYYAEVATASVGAAAGAMTGFWAWLGFSTTTALAHRLFESQNKTLFLISIGYHLVEFVVMGAILGAWV